MVPVGVLWMWGAYYVGATSILSGIIRQEEGGWTEGTGLL